MKRVVIAIGVAIIIGLAYLLLSQKAEAPTPSTQNTSQTEVGAVEIADSNMTEPLEAGGESADAESIIIEKSSLSEGQQKVLETAGIEGDIEITPEMIACAEEKVGKERLAEIIAGDTPSFFEGAQLLSCY